MKRKFSFVIVFKGIQETSSQIALTQRKENLAKRTHRYHQKQTPIHNLRLFSPLVYTLDGILPPEKARGFTHFSKPIPLLSKLTQQFFPDYIVTSHK